MRYRIGEFAELSGVSTKTLRHYDKVGLLRPAAVDARTRYRCYATTQLCDLSAILALRDLGLSLPEIRAFLDRRGSHVDRRGLLLRIRQSTERAIGKATQSLHDIDAALDQKLDQPGAWTRAVHVVMKRRPAMRVASLRAPITNYADVLPLERQLLSALPSESIGAVRGVMWHRGDDGSIDAEPFTQVRHDLPRHSFYELKDLPPVIAGCAFSGNDDAVAEQAYAAIRGWMVIRGFTLAGPKREIYLDNMLEIQFPLKSA